MTVDATPTIASLSLKSGNPLTVPTDALVLATTSDNKFDIVANGLPKAALTKIKAALSAVGASGGSEEVVRIPAGTFAKAQVIVAVGLGSIRDGISEETLRRAAGAVTRSLAGTKRVSLALPASYPEAAGAILEGAALGAYSFTDHRHASLSKSKSPVKSITLFADEARSTDFRAALDRARVVAQAVTFTRNLINYSPLHLPPAELAAAAKDLLSGTEVKVTVLDEKALLKDGYGGILAVGQGSARPPRLIQMSYTPKNPIAHVALVGKGITFDTGGISLKPPANMHEMKADMSGAAAVVATIKAVADLGLPVQVTAYAACAENMPGGNAQRPGDVISIYGGGTVEVLNTDCEGRLVLADAIVRASEDNPDLIVDIATLTSHAVVALGHRTAAVLGDEDVRNAIMAASERAGEAFWPMPMPSELRATLDSLVADIINQGPREGGMLSAGLFLKEFVPAGQAWGHLDIAGPAFNTSTPYGYVPRGGVGFGVRTMLALVEDLATDAS
jgi:leucyl aminopeptidase